MSKNRIAVLVALEGADEGLKRALQSADRSLDELAGSARSAGDKASAGVQSISAQLSRLKTELLALVGFSALTGMAKQFVETADAVRNLDARLKLSTKTATEFAAAKQGVVDIAKRTGASLESVGQLYTKIADAMRQLGFAQKDTLAFTEATAQAMRLSGASTAAAEAGITQLAQALSSGVLRGDEFNSIMENSPRLAQAMADGLGVPKGALRAMAEEGKLTADVVTKAILQQSAVINKEFAALPVTVGQAMTNLRTAFTLWVGEVDASTGATTKLATALDWLAKNVGLIMSTLGTLAAIALPALANAAIPLVIAAFRALSAAMAPVLAEMRALQGMTLSGGIAAVGALNTAFNGLVAAWAGWQIGTWARENFEGVRQAGVAMASGLHVAFATLTGASDAEIQAIKDGYFELFQAASDQSRTAAAEAAAAATAAAAKTKAQLEEEVAAYKALGAQIKEQYNARLADLDIYLKQQISLIQASGASEGAQATATTEAMKAAHQERLGILKQQQTEILKLIDQEKDARLASAKQSGESEQKITLEALNAKRAALAEILKATQAHFNDLAGQYNAHLQHVIAIEDAKRKAVAGVEATLRDLARETMTTRQAYYDKLLEIEELQSKARQALAQGDFKKAQEYAEQSISLAKSTAQEVSDADGVVVTKRQAVDAATVQVKQSLDLMKQAYDGQGAAAKAEAAATAQAMKETAVDVTTLKAAIDALDQQLKAQHTLTVNSNVKDVKAEIDSLNGRDTASTHTITVRRVEANAAGGMVGAGLARFARGGHVGFPGMKSGRVPGTGNSDTVPRTLEAGAFVIRKAAVQKYGEGLLSHFALGGAVRGGGGSGTRHEDENPTVRKTLEMIGLGLGASDAALDYMQRRIGTYMSPGARVQTRRNYEGYAQDDTVFLTDILYRKTLTGMESARLEQIKQRWKGAMSQSLVYGVDMERELIERTGSGYAHGGAALAASDTVPAMLTPGEYVIRRETVQRLGVGFFDAINRMKAPAQEVARRVRGYAGGGVVESLSGLASRASRAVRENLDGRDLLSALGESLAASLKPVSLRHEGGAEPSQTVKLQFVAPDGGVTTARTDSRADAQAILRALHEAGARTV